jgi:hypothetical protein
LMKHIYIFDYSSQVESAGICHVKGFLFLEFIQFVT